MWSSHAHPSVQGFGVNVELAFLNFPDSNYLLDTITLILSPHAERLNREGLIPSLQCPSVLIILSVAQVRDPRPILNSALGLLFQTSPTARPAKPSPKCMT